MADPQTKARPLSNKGLLLKADPALIPDENYAELTNLISTLEGQLVVRGGNRRLSNTTGLAPIDTITKLRTKSSPTQDIYYVSEGGEIWSAPGPLPAPGAVLNFTPVAAGVSIGSKFTDFRVGSADYAAGTVGTPYKFFGGNQKMLKDNGAMANLQQWGITPPGIVPIAVLDKVTILPPDVDLVASVGSNTRLSGVIVTAVFFTAPGPLFLNVNNAVEVNNAMLLNIGGQLCVPNSVTNADLRAYMNAAPAPNTPITSGIATATAPAALPVINCTIDASFSGLATEGYSSGDLLHVSIKLSDPTQFTSLAVRVFLDGSGSDYYEKLIIDPANGLTGNLSAGSWNEIDIPKDSFDTVGLAGTGPYTWQNVRAIEVVYTAATSTTPTISISSIYFRGGYGPNALVSDSTAPLTPYHYVYTFYNAVTGAESNPTVEMIQDAWVTPAYQRVRLTLSGTDDPQITGANALKVYRAGGSFADDLYRFVGYAANPGLGKNVYFIDTQSDATIASLDIAEFDNDAPVTSSLPVPVALSLNAIQLNGGATRPCWFTVNVVTGPTPNIGDWLTPGTRITIARNTSKQESAVVWLVNPGPYPQPGTFPNNTIAVFFQYDHTDLVADGTVIVEADAVAMKACDLVVAAFDSLFLAGDSYNPHVLYKSKTGRPEAFPVIDLESGAANQVNVGSPSNPIVNMTEAYGGILCLNARNLFFVGVNAGVMQAPQATPAQRGLIARDAWCQVDNEIWYGAYDGIYSFSGGQAVWRSEAIDPLFHGLSAGNYAAIDFRPGLGTVGADIMKMAAQENEVYFLYTDVTGRNCRARYHTKFDRWSIEYIGDPQGATPLISAMYADRDNGQLLIAKNSKLYLDAAGTTDGCFASDTDGALIPFAWTPGTLSQNPKTDKLFSDWVLELANDKDAITAATYYDFSAVADATDAYVIAAPPVALGRRRYAATFHQGAGFEGYAVSQRFSGATAGFCAFYSLSLNFIPLAQYSVGPAFDYTDYGYPCEKILRSLEIEMDSGGIACTIRIFGDGAQLGPDLSITTTAADRKRIVTLVSNLIAKNIKLVLIPGAGGKANYYTHSFDFLKEPCAVYHFDSYEFTFAYNGYSFVKQCWFEYTSQSPVTVTFYRDGGVLFYAVTLPAHPQRDVERFFLPAYVGAALNKSKRRRFTIDGQNLGTFKFYQDASRLEWMPVGADMRSAYQQAPLTTIMGPQV